MTEHGWYAEWAGWLAQQGFQAGYGQTPTWARLREITIGATAHLVDISRGGIKIAGALLLHRKPQPNDNLALRVLRYSVLECVQGPVLPPNASPDLLGELLDRVESLARRLGASQISFIARPTAAKWPAALSNVFRERNYQELPLLTSMVDLTIDEETIFERFGQAARKGVRKCEKNAVTIERVQNWVSHRADFLVPFYSSVGHEGIARYSDATERKKWAEETASGMHRFFVAKIHDGPVLATLGTYAFNGLATEIMSGRTLEGVASNLPAQDLLHWEVFKFHKAAGDKFFDMAGFSPAPKTAKEVGIRRFKEKWGGQIIAIPSYRRDLPSLANKLIAGGRVVKRLLRGARAN